MDLKSYFRTLPDEAARSAFAMSCGTTLKYLRMVAYGAKTIGESLALRVEQESGGLVAVEVLRPDVPWHVVRGKPAAVAATPAEGQQHSTLPPAPVTVSRSPGINSTGPIKDVPDWGKPLVNVVMAMAIEQAHHQARYPDPKRGDC